MPTTAAHAGMVVLFDRVSGHRLERWPVDARELLATGGFTTDPSSLATAAPVPVPSVVESPAPVDATPSPKSRRRGKAA